jgi:hypothetical protein
MSVLELIFGGMSALSSAVAAWVALVSRSQGSSKVGDGARRLPRWDWQKIAPRLLVFVSVASAVIGVYLIGSALTEDSRVKEAPLLRAVIPATFGKGCEAEEPPDEALASLACTPSPRIPSAHYALFHDTAAMNRAMSARVSELGLPKGDCETNGFAVSAYGTEGEGNWGRLLCYVDEEGSHVDWTNEDLRILASALAPVDADNELYEWWRYEGGPLPTSNLKSFPTGNEEDLLKWIPAAYRKNCSRSNWGGRTAKASVVCQPKNLDLLGFASYETRPEMREAFESRLGRSSENDNPPCSAHTRKGDSSYNIGSQRVGRLVCYVSEGIGYYEWTYDRAQVTVYARRDDGDMAQLYGWWRRMETPG